MKYLKYFNNHNIRESFQTQNTDNTLVHYCEDRNHLHYLNCDQAVENTPEEQGAQTNDNSFNPISILNGVSSTFNISNINYVNENLNYIKEYYNLSIESDNVFDDEVTPPVIGRSEDYIYFPNENEYLMSDVPPINNNSSCTGYGLAEDYTLYYSIETSNKLSEIVNNNISIFVGLYLRDNYIEFNLVPVEYGTTTINGETHNILIYMSLPNSISYSEQYSLNDIPSLYAIRVGQNLQVVFPFQQFVHIDDQSAPLIPSGGGPS